MPEIYDNLNPETQLGFGLTNYLQASHRMDVATGYFNLRGWQIFSHQVQQKIENNAKFPIARILIGMLPKSAHADLVAEYQQQMSGVEPGFIDRSQALKRKNELISALRDQLTQGCPTQTDRKVLAQLQNQLRSGAVEIKIHTDRPLHGKTYILHRNDPVQPIVGFVGSSNLTLSGLTTNLELNTDIRDLDGTRKLNNWFEERWNDRFSLPLNSEILQLLEDSWASENLRAPYEVFLKVCYDLSKDAREGISEYTLSPLISNILLDYQATAVKTLAKRIVNRRGTMLGDVVGLGKTLTAIAVALMLRDEHGYQPLILCPKNLVPMWQKQLDSFEIAGKVVSYSRTKDLQNLRRYQFVIVDESHTLRNEKTESYRNVQRYISDNDSKVLLLTATPYNLAYSDVANQLGLFISDDEDLGIQPTEALADPDFKRNLEFGTSTLAAFRKSDSPDDWKRLMSEFLVRRTRSFIRQNYALKDEETGREYLTFTDGSRFIFPDRKAIPVDHTFSADDPALQMVSDETINSISKLILPRYRLHKYVIPDELVKATDVEKKAIGDAEQSRGHVSGFVRSNFYKRLSSCGHSFILSLQRHLARNNLFIYAIENGLKLPTGDIDPKIFSAENDEGEFVEPMQNTILGESTKTAYESLQLIAPKNITWISSSIFDSYLLRDLRHDTEIIAGLLHSFGVWQVPSDSKLAKVHELLTKVHPHEKVLIFTEYKDTAEYVGAALESLGVKQVAVATGDVEDPTALALRFSPVSNRDLRNERGLTLSDDDEIRVLVTTDVLSEGQNLQDAHVVINYDIPWAIIQLIQRAGRVDRVGQEAAEVLIYTLSHGGLEDVLSLRRRVQQRLGDNAKTFGSDEKFFGTDEETQLITDLFQGRLAEESAGEDVDATSIAFEIWSKAVKNNPQLAQRIAGLPNLIDATRKARLGDAEGVICHVQTENGLDGFAWASVERQQLLTGHEAIRLLQVSVDEPGSEQILEHDDLVADLVKDGGILREHVNEIGRIRGVREKVWKRLGHDVYVENDAEAKRILETLHSHPFTRDATDKLFRVFRNGVDNAALVDLLKSLERDGRLFVEKNANSGKLNIVSVMGVKA